MGRPLPGRYPELDGARRHRQGHHVVLRGLASGRGHSLGRVAPVAFVVVQFRDGFLSGLHRAGGTVPQAVGGERAVALPLDEHAHGADGGQRLAHASTRHHQEASLPRGLLSGLRYLRLECGDVAQAGTPPHPVRRTRQLRQDLPPHLHHGAALAHRAVLLRQPRSPVQLLVLPDFDPHAASSVHPHRLRDRHQRARRVRRVRRSQLRFFELAIVGGFQCLHPLRRLGRTPPPGRRLSPRLAGAPDTGR